MAATTTRSPRVPRSRTLRLLTIAVSLGLLVVLSTGCLTGDIGVKVNKDGSGNISIKIFPTDELQQLIVAGNLVPVARSAVDQVSGSSFEQINEDGRVGYKVELPFDDYQALGQALIDGVTIGESHLRIFSDFHLTELNGNWNLEATLAPEMLSDALRADPTTEQLINTEGLVPLNSDLRLTIALPGRVTNTNGAKAGTGSAMWTLKTNQNVVLKMTTVPKPLLTETQKVLLGALLAVIFGVFLVTWGSQRSWGSGVERRERKRSKKLRFSGNVAKPHGWTGEGPLEHAPEGTVPKSGPMPPRAIPTIGPANGSARSAFAETAPQVPLTGELPPVAPPVAPAPNATAPNPWAPHRPGAPLPGENLPGTDRRPAVYGTAPDAVPAAVAPEAAPTSSAEPTEPEYVFAPPVTAEPAPVPVVPPSPAQLSAEEASAHHDAFYRDPTHEMSGLSNKVAEAHLRDLDPLAPDASMSTELAAPAESAEPIVQGVTDVPASVEKAPWWFESDTGAAGVTSSDVAPEPAWAPTTAEAAPVSPFTTGPSPSSAETSVSPGDEVQLEGEHYVSVGGGFFDYEPSSDVVEEHAEVDTERTAVEEPGVAPTGSLVAGALDDGPAWVSEESWEPDPDTEYPSIDGSGGLDMQTPMVVATEPEVEYPSIDGDGGLTSVGDEAIPPDWYPDPDDPNRYRWWDGVDWTDYVSESGS